jgi:hypothetical protein
MFRIHRLSDGRSVTLQLSGRLESEQIPEIQEQIDRCADPPRLDLREVLLVDRAVVRFLLLCQGRGIEILNCPLYIQEWMIREKLHENGASCDP